MTNSRSSARRWWAPASIGIIAAAMVAVVVLSDGGSGDQQPGGAPSVVAPNDSVAVDGPPVVDEPTRINVERRDPNDPLAVGDLEAPVAVIMYSDFQCPYCGMWSEQTLPAILEYVEAGDVRMEWRDVVFFGDGSERAALAAYAAGMQGEYLAFSQELFAGGEIRSASELSDDGLAAIAERVGLDVDQFNADRVAEAAAAGVAQNVAEASSLGASSTPAFLINGRPVVGAQPTEVFISAIEEEIALAQ